MVSEVQELDCDKVDLLIDWMLDFKTSCCYLLLSNQACYKPLPRGCVAAAVSMSVACEPICCGCSDVQ